MRLSSWLLIAVLSAAAVGGAATRSRYGGTLRVEMRAAPAALDPAAADAGPLRSLVFETLVRLDEAGAPQPCLALSWQHDAAARRWQFNLRPAVKFHDGSPLIAAAVAPLLQAALPATTVAAASDTAITIRANHPLPDLLLDLAHNGWLDTGPFRSTTFDPGRRAAFAANGDYWGGRPFLDAIEVQLGRGLRDQLADLELGKADVVEAAPTDLRRASGGGRAIWSSADVSLIALAFAHAPGSGDASTLREALALSIDRAAMHTVLLQKQGEVSAALLPQWISGYAFAFPTTPDLPRARALLSTLAPAARTLTLTYDPSLREARSLAERVAVNARDAGLAVQVSPQNPRADVRLVEVRLASLDPAQALGEFAAALGLQAPDRPRQTPPRLFTNPSASCWMISARSRCFTFPCSTAQPAASACMRPRRSPAWAIGASTMSGSREPRHDLSHASVDRLRARRHRRRGVRGGHRFHHHPTRLRARR